MIIAIVGATGLVGRTILNILYQKGYTQNNEILLYASTKSAGTNITINNQTFYVQELTHKTINPHISFAFFSAGGTVSKTWAKEFTKNGTIVIDNSNAYRRCKNVPLVVPEINFNSIGLNHKILANPNCSTIGLCVALAKLHSINPIKRLIVSTYQAVSGGGQKGITDLQTGTCNKFTYPIKNNLIPHIDKFLNNGYTLEEDKLRFETSKIFNSKINLCATAVRVPVLNCHAESVNIEFTNKIYLTKLKQILLSTSGVTLLDDTINNLYPMPQIANNTDNVFVGRVRKDYTTPNSYNMFLCFDNLRKGAALNAVQIMQKYIECFYK